MANTILEMIQEKYSNVPGINKARNIAEAVAALGDVGVEQDEMEAYVQKYMEDNHLTYDDVKDMVEGWLDDHTEGGEIVVDNTLTISGAAADSKKTGDEIDALKEDLTQVSEESGVSETSVTVDSSDVRDGWPSTSIGATAQIGGSSTKTKTIVNAVAVEGGKRYKLVITNGETVTLVNSRSIVFTNSQSKIAEYVNYTNGANANESTTVIYTPTNDGYVWIAVDYTYSSVAVYELKPVYTALDAVSRGYLYENIIKNVLNPNDVLIDQCSGINVGSNIESVVTRIGYISTKPISVRAGERYIFNAQGYLTNIIYANENKIIVSNHVLTAGEAFTIPDGVYYMQYSFSYNAGYMSNGQWKERVMLIKGESIPTYYLPYSKFAIADGTGILSPIATMTGRKKKAYIILNFDASEDAQTGFFTYRKSLLDTYGFKGCPCITKVVLNDDFDAWASEANRQQYFSLLAEGHDVGLYTSQRGDAKNESQWNTFLATIKESMESLGICNIVGYHCTGNNLTQDLYNALKAQGFKVVRANQNTFQPSYFLPINVAEETLIPIATIAMQGEVTTASLNSIKNIIDNAISAGSALSIMTHLVLDTDDPIDEWNCHLSMFTEILSYIKAKVDNGDAEVITWRELYQMMNPHDSMEYDYNRLLKMGIFAQS